MTTESIQATAENLRADFLNATTTHQRWKVLNRAIDWAVAASENADHYRQQAQAKEHTVNLTLDSAVFVERVRAQLADGGLVRGPGVSALVGENVEGEVKVLHPGEAFRHPDYPDETWVVLSGRFGQMVEIAPLAEDCEMRKYLTRPENLFA